MDSATTRDVKPQPLDLRNARGIVEKHTRERGCTSLKCGIGDPIQCDAADIIRDLLATIDRQSALLEAAQNGLEDFGHHKSGCGIWAGMYRVKDPSKKCTCGLIAAIAAIATKERG